MQHNMNILKILALKKSCIVISNSFDNDIEILQQSYKRENLRIYSLTELKIDNATEIIKEAYISTTEHKLIAIFAQAYNQFSQNALLKTLEEPPKNVIIILFVNARNKLIKTIYSRLAHFDIRTKTNIKPIDLDIKKLNIPMIYNYISKLEKENISTEQGRDLVTGLLKSVADNDIRLDEFDLARFDLALKALYAKQSVHLVILPLLLSLVRRA